MKRFRKLAGILTAAALFCAPCFAGEVFHGAYLQGFPDGSIRPEQAVTRAELAQILYRMMDETARKEAGGAESAFLDVAPSDWEYEAVCAMAYFRLMLGDGGCFRPDEGVTGEELSIILERIRASEDGRRLLSALSSGWQAQEVTFAAGNGWVMGLHGVVFSPEKAFTRAELAALFNRLLGREPESLVDLMIGMPLFTDNLDTRKDYFLPIQEAAIDHTAELSGGGEHWTGLG